MSQAEVGVKDMVTIVEPLAKQIFTENASVPPDLSRSRHDVANRVTRCVIVVLIGVVAILFWQLYEYRKIVSILHKTVDHQNVLLYNAMEIHNPTDLRAAF
jgi:hypothetical protein